MDYLENDKQAGQQKGSMTLEMVLFLSSAAICAAAALPILFEHLKTEFSAFSETDVMETNR